MSDAPVTFITAFHRPILPLVPNDWNAPTPYSVGVTLLGGVARRVPANTPKPARTTSDAKINLAFIAFSFVDEVALARVRTLRRFRPITKRQNV
jgi:hypothetical protein